MKFPKCVEPPIGPVSQLPATDQTSTPLPAAFPLYLCIKTSIQPKLLPRQGKSGQEADGCESQNGPGQSAAKLIAKCVGKFGLFPIGMALRRPAIPTPPNRRSRRRPHRKAQYNGERHRSTAPRRREAEGQGLKRRSAASCDAKADQQVGRGNLQQSW